MLSKLKPEFKDFFVAFAGGGRVNLGDREDLDKLAIIAQESKDPTLLRLFEEPLPTLEALKKADVDAQLAKKPTQENPAPPAQSAVSPDASATNSANKTTATS